MKGETIFIFLLALPFGMCVTLTGAAVSLYGFQSNRVANSFMIETYVLAGLWLVALIASFAVATSKGKRKDPSEEELVVSIDMAIGVMNETIFLERGDDGREAARTLAEKYPGSLIFGGTSKKLNRDYENGKWRIL